ncbi:MAG TPA: hypothetical protein VJ865_05770 [Gemmatimonadaceae bacterium]|nr:hypothetical protein [Gemmatimonadaceae bacterium]
MQRSRLDRIARTTLAALIAVASGCATVDTAIVANPGVEFNLPLGQTAALSGTGYRITFTRVTEDSRCPIDVVCVWAGDAKIQLAIDRSSAPADIRILGLTPPNSESDLNGVRIRFVSLAPAPRQSEPSGKREYVARLVVIGP